jgi:hypothetical protein
MKNDAPQPRVLLVWPQPLDYLPPPAFSDNQVTLCPRDLAKGGGLKFYSIPQGIVECPSGDFDLYEFVHRCNQIEDKKFDLILISLCSYSILYCKPLNTKKFGCPTVLLSGDTHHGIAPISRLLGYCIQENFDYVVTPHNRQHLHWFASVGVKNLAWLPLISMTVITHEWVQTREKRVTFFGRVSIYHPRRSLLINALRESGLPLVIKSGRREEGAHLFAHSLISLNCSLNGDINFRNLEIISAGGFLLTDRLSFASGFDEYLTPGLYCDTYDSYAELVEKIKFYLENPESAIEIAKRAYEKFFNDWHPKYRIADLINWVFNGDLPNFYAAKSEPRFSISIFSRDLVGTRLPIYEAAQELHRLYERPRVLVSRNCPPVIVADLLDLPRLDLYVEPGFPLHDLYTIFTSYGKDLLRVRVASAIGSCSGEDWDLLILRVTDEQLVRISSYAKENLNFLIVKVDSQLTRSSLVYSCRFAFVLGNENQINFSNAQKIG